jgi:hypothetical protein
MQRFIKFMMINSKDKLWRSAFLPCPLVFAMVLSGCASEVVYKADQEQLRIGQDLINLEIPKDKAILEFTTNTNATATLVEQVGPDLCKPERKAVLARVQRQRELVGAESAAAGIMNVVSLGLTKHLTENDTPISHAFYVEAEKELILQSTSYTSVPTGNGQISSKCGPLFLKFTPEGGERYKLFFVEAPDRCTAVLTKFSNSEQVVPNHTRWTCSVGFMDIGGGEVIGLREIKGN